VREIIDSGGKLRPSGAVNIAHEINNPLLPIRINLEHMLEDVQHKVAIDAEEIERTQESVERISRIVSRLLQFTGRRNIESAQVNKVDLAEIVEDVVGLNRKYFEQEQMVIQADLAELPQIYGDRDQLEQVLMNLILNARAMTKGGRLLIEGRVEDNYVVIRFKDTGYGIAPDLIDNIFEPFVSTKEDGTGLGLFISYGIIQNHRGRIEVESQVDVGSTFSIHLPIST
jgi:signal transduction histidine kinase